jgi:hypothetical protein
LLFSNDDDAVEKIIAVLTRQTLREELIRHLRHQAAKFSAEIFMEGLREVVEQFLARSGNMAALHKADATKYARRTSNLDVKI